MLPCFVVLDLETTGGNALRDRITEIAAVRVEHGVETARWSSLINPGVCIPAFIQALTGISDAMVADAPAFADIAPKLIALLEGAVFVAHNVRFDHGFVVQELARLEIAFTVKTLCNRSPVAQTVSTAQRAWAGCHPQAAWPAHVGAAPRHGRC